MNVPQRPSKSGTIFRGSALHRDVGGWDVPDQDDQDSWNYAACYGKKPYLSIVISGVTALKREFTLTLTRSCSA